MTDPTQPLKPQDQTNFLLGGLNAKMDTVIASQTTYETRLRTVEGVVAILNADRASSKQLSINRPQWWMVLLSVPPTLVSLGTVAYLFINHA